MPVRLPSHSILCPLGLAPAIFMALSCAPRSSDPSRPPLPISSAQSTPLIVDPSPITLGKLRQGQGARTIVTLRNVIDEDIVLKRFETSCDCIRATPAALRVTPHGSSSFSIAFDPAKDDDFQGQLSVSLTGYDPKGLVVLRTNVDLEVDAPPADPGRSASARMPSSVADAPPRLVPANLGGSHHGGR